MTTIGPNLPVSRSDAPSPLRIPPQPGSPAASAAPPPAQASISLPARLAAFSQRAAALEKADLEAARLEDTLARLDALISDLRGAISSTPAAPTTADAQARIDSLIRSIHDAAALGPRGAAAHAEFPSLTSAASTGYEPFYVTGLENVADFNFDIKFDTQLDLRVAVTASAQQAGLFLALGASTIPDDLAIEIAGARGATQLSFASGSSFADIAAAINALAPQTGVRAQTDSDQQGLAGIKLVSSDFGSTEFLSVRVIDSGRIDDLYSAAGIYELQQFDFNTVNTDPAARTRFGDAAQPVVDSGRDVQGSINGRAALGRGKRLAVESPGFNVKLELLADSPDSIGAQRLGVQDLLRIYRPPAQSPDAPPPLVPFDRAARLADAAGRALPADADAALNAAGAASDFLAIERAVLDRWRSDSFAPARAALFAALQQQAPRPVL
ncbi:MAG: flagellin hook IN motif-containing protein [Planctomycetota bacterium]|nr:flagellin hook IN motif-containing protein [Planctomycetota bacterium]